MNIGQSGADSIVNNLHYQIYKCIYIGDSLKMVILLISCTFEKIIALIS